MAMETDPWIVVSAVASAIAALAAMIAAGTALYQVLLIQRHAEGEREEAAILRSFTHSPYASESALKARLRLSKHFSNLKGNEVLQIDQVRTAFEGDRTLLADFNLLLAHWGRFATARKHDLVDRKVARDLLRFGFIRFWGQYKAYLDDQFATDPTLASQYADVRKLYEDWK